MRLHPRLHPRRWIRALPWSVPLAFFTLSGPLILVVCDAVPVPEHAVAWSMVLALGVGTCAMVWSFVAPRPEGSVFRWTALPWIVGFSAWWGACVALGFDRFDMPAPLIALPGLTALASALRRPRTDLGEQVRARDVLTRLALGAGILLSCGPLANLGDHFGGGWHPPLVIRAEHGAWHTLATGPLSFACDSTVAVILPAAVWLLGRSSSRRRAAGTPLLTLAVAAWGRAICDVLSMIAAYRIHEHALEGSPGGVDRASIETLSIVADLVGGLTLMVSVALLLVSAIIVRRRPQSSVALGLAVTYPVAIVLLATTSLLFAPRFVTSWSSQGWQPELPPTFAPLRRTYAVGDTTPRGMPALLHLGGVETPGRDGCAENGPRYAVLPDRRTPMREVFAFARRRPNRTPLALAWLRHDLLEAHSARQRWGFVDLTSGALSARTLILTRRASECQAAIVIGGSTIARCDIDDDELGQTREALVLRDPGVLDVDAWLDATEGVSALIAIQVEIQPASGAAPHPLLPDRWRWRSTERPIFWLMALPLGALMLRGSGRWARRWFDTHQVAGPRANAGVYRTAPPVAVEKLSTTRLWSAAESLVLTGLVVVGPTVLWVVLAAACRATIR